MIFIKELVPFLIPAQHGLFNYMPSLFDQVGGFFFFFWVFFCDLSEAGDREVDNLS